MTTGLGNRDYNVCLLGASLDVENMGCRALAASMIKLVLDANPSAEITLLYRSRFSGMKEVRVSEETMAKVRIVNCRFSPVKARLHELAFWILLLACVHRFVPIRALRKRICNSNPWLRCLKRADFVGDIHAGDSFADLYGLRRFLIEATPSLTAILMDKDLVFLPQTYGPYKSVIAQKIARFTMTRASRIYSRDMRSIEVVRDLLGKRATGKVIQFCPDVAFSLKAIRPRPIVIDPPLDSKGADVLVGLNVSGLLYMGGYTRNNMFGLRCNYKEFVQELLSRLVEETDGHILLVPHTFGSIAENDQDACRKVWQSTSRQYEGRVHMLLREYDQNEIKAVIGRCDFFIGSRMHSCIAALSQAIPTIGLAYSRKFLGVFDSVGMRDMVLDARRLSREELLQGCMARFKKKDAVAKSLRHVMPQIRSQLEACFISEMPVNP